MVKKKKVRIIFVAMLMIRFKVNFPVFTIALANLSFANASMRSKKGIERKKYDNFASRIIMVKITVRFRIVVRFLFDFIVDGFVVINSKI